jgi:hypothetical protein
VQSCLFACKEKEEKQRIFLLALSGVPCLPLTKILIMRILKSIPNFASELKRNSRLFRNQVYNEKSSRSACRSSPPIVADFLVDRQEQEVFLSA